MHNDIKMFESLYQNSLIDMDGVNEEIINKTPFSKLLDIYDEVSSSVSYLPQEQNLIGKVFTASNNFAGSSYECPAMKCRMNRVEELSKFSTLFGENVLFHNFLADSSPTFGHAPSKDSKKFRNRVIADINVLMGLKGVISKGIAVPYTMPHGFCLNCFTRKFLGNSSSQLVERELKNLENHIYKSMDMEIIKTESGFKLRCSSDNDILPHTYIHQLSSKEQGMLPDDILQNMHVEDKHTLSHAQKKMFSEVKRLSRQLMAEAVHQKSMSKLTGGSILTHSLAEVNTLKRLESDSQISHVNDILSEHWKIIIPYAEQLSVDNLLLLREREPESFIQFRGAIEKSVSEAISLNKGFSVRDARELFSDTIAPNIAKIEQSTKIATFDLIKKPLIASVGIGAVLGVGAYTGLLTGDLSVAAKALGLGKIVYDGVTSSVEGIDALKERKQADYYFLWRMQRLAKKA
ncbi:hypothetical protein E5N72_18955 [Pseudoalteromonas sp. MEBiC 03607]|uniref:hypothetical protein n=1 Tax=Pseudoalteromonas sp. MEBiC 03607 TaxID=2563601 RepID=UPI001093F4AE|nr:hypothetical protein [Pseudoalteromonas sp. MEBiC 03607]TGV17306.1 hypothetical protein E5N72_18955 [Pseudoalteromonas sp. MEBiC 03607]